MNVPTQITGGGDISPYNLRVIQDDMYMANSRTQTQMNWSRSGDDITVNFVSPTGTMKFYQARFSALLKPGNEFIQTPGPSLTSITFFDVNGIVVTAGAPSLSDFSIAIE